MKYMFYASNQATRVIKFLSAGEFISGCVAVVHDGCRNQDLENLTVNLGIKYIYIDDELGAIPKSWAISHKLLETMENHQIDYLFCFGTVIIKGEILTKFKNRMINFHPSLLPAFAGMHAVDKAMNNSCLLLGNTAHFIDKSIDGGLIIMQSILPKYHYRTYDDLLDLQLYMLKQIIIWLEERRVDILNDTKVVIRNAKYEIQTFIPNLEFEI